MANGSEEKQVLISSLSEKLRMTIFLLIPIIRIPFTSRTDTAGLAAEYLGNFNHLDSKEKKKKRKHATSVTKLYKRFPKHLGSGRFRGTAFHLRSNLLSATPVSTAWNHSSLKEAPRA